MASKWEEGVELTVSNISSSASHSISDLFDSDDGLSFSLSSNGPRVVVIRSVLPDEVIRACVYHNAKSHFFAVIITDDVPNTKLGEPPSKKAKEKISPLAGREAVLAKGRFQPDQKAQTYCIEWPICVTDHNATVRKRLGHLIFNDYALSFGIATLCSPSRLTPAAVLVFSHSPSCRSRTSVTGIELSADPIRFAELNDLAHRGSFRAADAAQILSAVGDFPT
ncbi:hypothetical protein EI94DRAFT_1832632 [Lactarius quietus]|nr:hypothetical protein EI94DRAFT_1832632 [Lactarius quietus]